MADNGFPSVPPDTTPTEGLAGRRRVRVADFDHLNHANNEGWGTYYSDPVGNWRRRLCRFLGHRLPSSPPVPANGYSPSNYVRCDRCKGHHKWFVVGQHRFGGYDRGE